MNFRSDAIASLDTDFASVVQTDRFLSARVENVLTSAKNVFRGFMNLLHKHAETKEKRRESGGK